MQAEDLFQKFSNQSFKLKTKGMEFSMVLGADQSKDWFNYCLMNDRFEILQEGKVDNYPAAIFEFADKLISQGIEMEQTLVCVEYTGIYVQHLVSCWLSKGGQVSVVPAVRVSQSLNGQVKWAEKTDELDARRLAEYAFRFTDKLQLWQAPDHTLLKLQSFQRQRDRLLKVINILEVPVKESRQFDDAAINKALVVNQAASIQALKKDLKKLEKAMTDLIKADPYLTQLFKLMTSVEGVGPVIAREILISTHGFTKFQPHQAKAFARYAGVVPLKSQSGKSLKRRNKTSHKANIRLKTVLTMGAHALINTKQQLGTYYHRKMAEGKHHYEVINAMRNKIILRIFAVVRNQTMYQKNLNLCLELP